MVKVTVCGGAGGIGQPLSLLVKLNPNVSELAIFDIVNAKGVAADLSHINTSAVVTGYQPKDKEDKSAIEGALKGTDIVVIPAGVPRKPGMTRADLFNVNASIVRDLAASIAKVAPNARVLIISNPVNSTVPIAAEVFKKLGVFNPHKLFGVTTLDSVRAETFLGDLLLVSPGYVKGRISVIGGHSGDTIVPLTNVVPDINGSKLSGEAYAKFVHRVQFGGDEVVQAKNGAGSATLSMAYAGYRFTEHIIESLVGNRTSDSNRISDSAYVYLPGLEGGNDLVKLHLNGVEYFSVPVELENGQIKSFVDPFTLLNITDDERKLVDVALKGLQSSIDQGVNFVAGSKL
ncbi:uncharacterized protein KQ657_002047 [Scheffersomyces spartinae]|uniref:Malate dehydrogenase n=1 Tax=Scheffersomyces spartinae TaxID=45513 RepID=A0A9P8AH48_9ASCO|nr:uncharacterized protein KQ657_002047 [Scheffersomyces spartinae]KAG7192328.1 hypothetical protein KQ657_002047 [Scheffersomyces spartinae]